MLTLTDPQFNLREIAKQLILLEDHLVHTHKRCPDCIRKHLLTAEGLAEEIPSLDQTGELIEKAEFLSSLIRRWLCAFSDGEDLQVLAQQIRVVRKVLVSRYYDPRARVATLVQRVSAICPHLG